MKPPERLVAAAAVLVLGVAFCFAMYGWQLQYKYGFHDPAGNLLLALPFAGLAVMVACGMGRLAAIVSWLILAALTGIAYVAAATSSSSTAALVFIAPFVYATFGVSVIFAVDQIVRHRKLVRPRPKLR